MDELFKRFLLQKDKDLYVRVMLGKSDLITNDLKKEYQEWLKGVDKVDNNNK